MTMTLNRAQRRTFGIQSSFEKPISRPNTKPKFLAFLIHGMFRGGLPHGWGE